MFWLRGWRRSPLGLRHSPVRRVGSSLSVPVNPGGFYSQAGSHSHTRRGDVECAASDFCGLPLRKALVLGVGLRLKSWSNVSAKNVSVGFGRNAEKREAPVGRSRSASSGVKFAWIAATSFRHICQAWGASADRLGPTNRDKLWLRVVVTDLTEVSGFISADGLKPLSFSFSIKEPTGPGNKKFLCSFLKRDRKVLQIPDTSLAFCCARIGPLRCNALTSQHRGIPFGFELYHESTTLIKLYKC